MARVSAAREAPQAGKDATARVPVCSHSPAARQAHGGYRGRVPAARRAGRMQPGKRFDHILRGRADQNHRNQPGGHQGCYFRPVTRVTEQDIARLFTGPGRLPVRKRLPLSLMTRTRQSRRISTGSCSTSTRRQPTFRLASFLPVPARPGTALVTQPMIRCVLIIMHTLTGSLFMRFARPFPCQTALL